MAEEISITITAPADKVVQFVAGFLGCRPVPLDVNEEPLYTVKEHIKRELIKEGFRIAAEGHKRIHAKTMVPIEADLLE